MVLVYFWYIFSLWIVYSLFIIYYDYENVLRWIRNISIYECKPLDVVGIDMHYLWERWIVIHYEKWKWWEIKRDVELWRYNCTYSFWYVVRMIEIYAYSIYETELGRESHMWPFICYIYIYVWDLRLSWAKSLRNGHWYNKNMKKKVSFVWNVCDVWCFRQDYKLA